MVRILEALGTLPPGDELRALMDQEPMMLYRELERRAWQWRFGEEDGIFVLTISRAPK